MKHWTKLEVQWRREVVGRPLDIRSLQIVGSPPHSRLFVSFFFSMVACAWGPRTSRNSTMTAINVILQLRHTLPAKPWATHRCDQITELHTCVVHRHRWLADERFLTERLIQNYVAISVITADSVSVNVTVINGHIVSRCTPDRNRQQWFKFKLW